MMTFLLFGLLMVVLIVLDRRLDELEEVVAEIDEELNEIYDKVEPLRATGGAGGTGGYAETSGHSTTAGSGADIPSRNDGGAS